MTDYLISDQIINIRLKMSYILKFKNFLIFRDFYEFL